MKIHRSIVIWRIGKVGPETKEEADLSENFEHYHNTLDEILEMLREGSEEVWEGVVREEP